MQNLSLAWLIGLVVLRHWLPANQRGRETMDGSKFGRSALFASTLLFALQFGLLWLEAAVMGDVALKDAGSAVVDVLRGTHYGVVWTIGFAVTVLLIGLSALTNTADRGRGRPMATALLVAVFAYTRSLISHAGDKGDVNWIVFLDWSHLLLIGAWVGEVLIATLLVLPRLYEASDGHATATFAHALSHSATVILIGVVITGVTKAWLGIGSPANLIGTVYGQVLIVKLAFVSVAIALGGFNRFLVLPEMHRVTQSTARGRVMRCGSQRRFLLVLQVETFALLCATAAAAVLSASALP
ncbi:MAG: CopD family protein [Burkholderiaceae bacterium]